MFQIENEADRTLVEAELKDWQRSGRQLMLRLDVQMDIKQAVGHCNEEAVAIFTKGLEECTAAIRRLEAILAGEEAAGPAAKARANGVHA